MPSPQQFTIDQELQFFKELEAINLRNDNFRASISPDLARNVSNLVYTAPRAPKEILMVTGRALTDNFITPQQADDIVVGTERKTLTSPITYKFDEPSAWDRIFGGIKSTAKWGIAGISFFGDIGLSAGGSLVSNTLSLTNLPKDVTRNVLTTGQIGPGYGSVLPRYSEQVTPASEYLGVPNLPGREDIAVIRNAVFQPPSLADQDLGTVLKSTQLGALLTGAESGNGWFIGDEALRIQNENAAKFSGTINGAPMTPGRGLALAVSRPGTVPYAILSNLVDIGVQMAMPAAPGYKPIRGKLITGLGDLDIAPILRPFGQAEPGEVIPLIRSSAGLTNFASPFIKRDKVSEWLDSNMGRYVMQRLANEDNYEEVARLFPKTDINFRQAIVDATEDNIREVLETNLGVSRGLGNIQDFNLTRLGDVRESMLNNKISRWSGAERLFADRAGNEIAILTDDPRTATRSVENLTNYLISLRVDPKQRKNLINQLAKVLASGEGNPQLILKEIQTEVVNQLALQRGLPKEMLNDMFTQFVEFKDQYVMWGQVGADDMPLMFGFDDVRQAGLLGKSADGSTGIFMIPDGTAMSSGEMRRASMFLPDSDRVYRATSQWRWLYESMSRDPKKFGNPNFLVRVINSGNKVWRQMITMTGGYVQRNLTESAVRSSLAPGIKAGPLNPIDYIATAIHTDGFGKYLGDVEGLPFTEYGQAVIYREFDDYNDAVNQTIRQNVRADVIEKRAAQTGAWQIVNKGQTPLYPQMLMDNIQILAVDELYRMVARGMTTDQIWYEISQKTQETQTAIKNLQRLHGNLTMQNAYTGAYEKATIEYIDELGNPNEYNLRKFIDLYVRPRVAYNTGGTRRPDGTWALDGDPRLMEIIANGDQLGRFTYNGRTVDAFKTAQLGPGGELVSIDYSDEFKQLISEVIDDPTMGPRMPTKGKARINIRPEGTPGAVANLGDTFRNFGEIFFTNLFTKPDAVLNRSPVWRKYYYEKIADLLEDLAPGEAAEIRNAVLRGKAFNAKEDFRKLLKLRPDADGLYQYGVKKITQEQYLDALKKRLIGLGFDKASATSRIDDLADVINNRPQDLSSTVISLQNEVRTTVLGTPRYGARWVGSKDLWKKIVDKADGATPSAGTLTAEQVSQAAKIFAGEATLKVFFDASSQSNIGEVLRIIAPFGRAFREQMRFFSRALTQDPEKLKKGVVLMDGTRGFFYNDPVTGEPYFNYGPTDVMMPIIFGMLGLGAGGVAAGFMSRVPAAIPMIAGGAAGAALGVKTGSEISEVSPVMRAPAKSLSMAFNVLPSVGPVVQIPANQILNRAFPEVKSLDAIRNFLFPFGPPEGFLPAFTPAYLKKLEQWYTQDPETDTLFGQLTMDSFMALMASGKYDRTNPFDVSRAYNKASSIGGWLTLAQGIGQFVGPARPSIVMEVPTQFEGALTIGDVNQIIKDGDVTNITLTRVFRLLQEQDYDTAPQKFIELFGENAIYYMAGRTTTEVRGLQATKEFGDWQTANSDFAATHKDVFGWFAPLGSTFDKQAYIVQIQRGLRERRTDPFELVEDVEYVAASGLYRTYQKELGADGEVTPLDKDKLKQYRAQLEEYFPGYKLRSQITDMTEDTIQRAVTAAEDPRIQGNVVAEAIQAYNQWRTWAIDQAQTRRTSQGKAPAISNILTGQANADLRSQLRDVGELIIQQTPEFARIYDAVFYFEIDEVG